MFHHGIGPYVQEARSDDDGPKGAMMEVHVEIAFGDVHGGKLYHQRLRHERDERRPASIRYYRKMKACNRHRVVVLCSNRCFACECCTNCRAFFRPMCRWRGLRLLSQTCREHQWQLPMICAGLPLRTRWYVAIRQPSRRDALRVNFSRRGRSSVARGEGAGGRGARTREAVGDDGREAPVVRQNCYLV